MHKRGGFTLVELLVVIAIIGILVALLLPAIQAAREAARRTQCNNNLKNIGLGLQNYHDTYKVFPMGAMHAGPRVGGQNSPRLGPSWWYGVLPFMEQRNIYDKVGSLQRQGATGDGKFNAQNINTELGSGGPLNKLVPDFMRCPSSPIDVMADQTGTVALPTYVGISGGTDITTTALPDTTLYPNQTWGRPTSTQRYVNRSAATLTTGPAATIAVITNSGMLPVAEHTNMAKCSDGTSNTMIVSEQSDWLGDTDPTISTKYHGDPGWGGPNGGASGDTNLAGGFISGTTHMNRIPQGLHTANNVTIPLLFNVTTVRYKPDLKKVIGSSTNSAPGCAEIGGHNNPLQSAHPGGILCAFVDGSVQFVAGTTDLGILLRIAIRDDGQNVKLP